MSVSATTVANLVLGPGAATYGGTDLGATKDNATLSITRQATKGPMLNGASAPLKGATYVFEEIAKLTLTLAEWDLEKFTEFFPHATLSGDGSTTPFSLAANIGRIPDAAFKDLVFVVNPGDGLAVTITIKNALVDFEEDFEAEFGNEADGGFELTFVGHADPADPTASPYTIEKAIA